jgi:hypothetical protein
MEDTEMQNDVTRSLERSNLAVKTDRADHLVWACDTKLEKFLVPKGIQSGIRAELEYLDRYKTLDGKTSGEIQAELLAQLGVEPEVVDIHGNLLMYGGASCQWQTLIGNGTATAGQSLTYFNNAQAAIGVGDTNTAAVATTNDLVATTNKLRVAMDATFPTHTDGVVVGSASAVFKSTFATGQANWAWAEWGVFNSASAGTGRMLNRKVEALGTKTSASTWALTVTLTLA